MTDHPEAPQLDPAGMPVFLHWGLYHTTIDDEPASIYLDMAARDALADHPIALWVDIAMHQTTAKGLTHPDEATPLLRIEDGLKPVLERVCGTVFVARATFAGVRRLLFYATTAEGAEAAVREAMAGPLAAIGDYPDEMVGVESRDDPQWQHYCMFLPDEEGEQEMRSNHVLGELDAMGDDLTAPRVLDHLARFATEADRDQFRALAEGQGFTVTDTPDQPLHADTRHGLAFTRRDAPAGAVAIARELHRMATAHGGVYAGWGCEAVRTGEAGGSD